MMMKEADKIISIEDFVKVRTSLKDVVLVGGCFDVIHYGHIQFLRRAKEKGEILVVALEPDEFLKKNKKREPFHSQQERAEILAALESVDYVIPLPSMKSDEEYLQLVEQVKPSIIAVTENDSAIDKKKKHAEKVGAEVVVVTPQITKFSTTALLNHAPISRD